MERMVPRNDEDLRCRHDQSSTSVSIGAKQPTESHRWHDTYQTRHDRPMNSTAFPNDGTFDTNHSTLTRVSC
jgi:hypothetical protein